MNYLDNILDNLQARFDQDTLDRFGIEKFDYSLEVTTPAGAFVTITDKGQDFSFSTAYTTSPERRPLEHDNLTLDKASDLLIGLMAAHS